MITFRIIAIAMTCLLFGGTSYAQWTLTSEPYKGAALLTTFDTLLFAEAYDYISVTGDYGETWAVRDGGYLYTATVRALVRSDSELYAVTSFNGVFRSLDTGRTWQYMAWKFGSGIGVNPGTMYTIGDTFLIRGAGHGLLRSTNRGSSWDVLWHFFGDTSCNAFALGDRYLYTASDRNGVFRSSDAGLTWEALLPNINGPGLSDTIFYDVATSGSIVYGASHYGMYRSTDRGTTWEFSSDGIGRQDMRCVYIEGRVVYAGANHHGGVYASFDSGGHWVQTMTIDSERDGVSALTSLGGYLFAAGGAGVWRRPLSDFGAVVKREEPGDLGPRAFRIKDGIEVRWPDHEGVATVQIYDVLGRRLLATQAHFPISALSCILPDGIFIVRMDFDGRSFTQRIVH